MTIQITEDINNQPTKEVPILADCEHTDVEDMHCLDCGADRTEDIMSAAYDRMKDIRKYGE